MRGVGSYGGEVLTDGYGGLLVRTECQSVAYLLDLYPERPIGPATQGPG